MTGPNSTPRVKKGLVLGAYTDDNKFKLTPVAEAFDKEHNGVILENLNVSGIKKGKSRIFFKPTSDYDAVAVVGLGKESVGINEDEDIDEGRENVRVAAGVGVKSLQELEVLDIKVEGLGAPEAAAEGANLALWTFQEFKSEKNRKKIADVSYYDNHGGEVQEWNRGTVLAQAQNLVRTLADSPANLMTPTIFVQRAEKELTDVGVQVTIRDRDWIESQKMCSFLSVARGSDEPPKFLEINYSRGNDKPIVLVGKGVTFDSGGISIKPSAKMEEMRADMSGAAVVVGTIKAIAQLKLPINVIGLTPLTENLPGGRATKPGDIVKAMNGKSIQIDNTDAEGRLILADALCYAANFNPRVTVDIATLTGAMRVALGGAASGVFSSSTSMWENLKAAGTRSGDRVWRFPLYKVYTSRITDCNADLNNIGKGPGGGACTAAAFLKEFAPNGDWIHMDIAGVMGPESFSELPYLGSGMTGRPTRTLIQFIQGLSSAPNKK